VQDLTRVGNTDGLVVKTAPQNRTIFFGMNVGADDLENDNVEGANPLADVRVRQAMNMAINREAIQQVVMRGQSAPAGMIAPPFVNGWTEEMDAISTDIEGAKALMAEAGYEDGFSIQLDCPNDRYVNDEGICQAVVGMMAQIGVTVNLDAKPKAQHFPLITNDETDFFMLGWGVPTYDSAYVFNFLVHTRGSERGSWNATGYSNEEIDAMIQSLESETDLDKRNATIQTIWDEVQEQTLYLPIHHQVLNWGMAEKVGTEVSPEDDPKIKFFSMNERSARCSPISSVACCSRCWCCWSWGLWPLPCSALSATRWTPCWGRSAPRPISNACAISLGWISPLSCNTGAFWSRPHRAISG